jgi:hypothetical protein
MPVWCLRRTLLGTSYRQKVVNNLSEALRRLELRLPESHWIFSIAPGERAGCVRRALDVVALVNRRFDAIEELLRSDEVAQAVPETPSGFVSDVLSSVEDLFD